MKNCGEPPASPRPCRLQGLFAIIHSFGRGAGETAAMPGVRFPAQCKGVGTRDMRMPIVLNDRIEINPSVCHGKPVVRGTRVLVSQVLGALAGGDSIEDVLADYPSLSAEDLPAVFAFAGSLARFEDIPYESAGVAL